MLAQHQHLYKILVCELARTLAQALLALLCIAKILGQPFFLAA